MDSHTSPSTQASRSSTQFDNNHPHDLHLTLFRQPKDPNLKPTNIASLIYIVTHHQQHRQLREKEEDVHLADEFTPPESYHCMY
jgi:hypothetical protein